MCMQAHFLREPTYYNNLSRSLLASLWWEAVNRSSGKTHLVEESYGSPQMFPLKEVIGRNEKSKVFWIYVAQFETSTSTDQNPDNKNLMIRGMSTNQLMLKY